MEEKNPNLIKCCELTNKTIELFNDKFLYKHNTDSRRDIFVYWNFLELNEIRCADCKEKWDQHYEKAEAHRCLPDTSRQIGLATPLYCPPYRVLDSVWLDFRQVPAQGLWYQAKIRAARPAKSRAIDVLSCASRAVHKETLTNGCLYLDTGIGRSWGRAAWSFAR